MGSKRIEDALRVQPAPLAPRASIFRAKLLSTEEVIGRLAMARSRLTLAESEPDARQMRESVKVAGDELDRLRNELQEALAMYKATLAKPA